MVKNLSAMQETSVQYLGWEDPFEKRMAMHSSILAWRIPWTLEKLGGLLSMGLQKVGHNWATNTHTHINISPSCGKVSLSEKVFVFLRSFNTFLNSKVRNCFSIILQVFLHFPLSFHFYPSLCYLLKAAGIERGSVTSLESSCLLLCLILVGIWPQTVKLWEYDNHATLVYQNNSELIHCQVREIILVQWQNKTKITSKKTSLNILSGLRSH